MRNPFETERLWAGAPRRGEAHYFMRALPESFASVGQAMGFVSSCLVSGCLGKQGLAHRPFMGLAARGTCHAHLVLADAQQRADLALDTAVDCASGFRADKDEVFHSIQLFDCRLRAQAKARLNGAYMLYEFDRGTDRARVSCRAHDNDAIHTRVGSQHCEWRGTASPELAFETWPDRRLIELFDVERPIVQRTLAAEALARMRAPGAVQD